MIERRESFPQHVISDDSRFNLMVSARKARYFSRFVAVGGLFFIVHEFEFGDGAIAIWYCETLDLYLAEDATPLVIYR
ncbi:hypothetical protein HK28_11815 [Acetobacter sp. DsW_063]|nr:hypothetical protein HK28_11815 [Acetobacter sp. DsW_063]